jgi:lysophospholipase L1-like esterase
MQGIGAIVFLIIKGGENMKILFQGDSITDGNRYKEERTRWDLNHQIGHSYAYMVSGYLGMKYPKNNLSFVNRGISGNTSRNIVERRKKDIMDISPEVLSLLAGTNDCSLEGENHVEPSEYQQNIQLIIDEISKQKQLKKIFLLEPFFLPVKDTYKENEYEWRKKYGQYADICRKIACDNNNIIFIPLQKIFDDACKLNQPNYWIWDGIHPTESGHALIASEWVKTFEKELA